MQPIQLSSGDLIADRRADYAEMIFEAKDAAAAADLMRDALKLAPGWTAGWFRLGEFLEACGNGAAAAEAWAEALRLDPADRLGATLKLGLVGGAHSVDAPPSAFVETLFDQYADRFDVHLVERLAYRVPELILAAIEATGAGSFAHVVDLGCGTGLMGERMRSRASFMEGFDISREMLRKAEAKRIYDRLGRADLQLLEPGGIRADLVMAADVFMYVGALDRIFATIAAMLAPSGLFAFSVERHPGSGPLVLLPSRRYAHGEAHLVGALARAGFDIMHRERATIRRDRDADIEGLVVVARRREDAREASALTAPAEETVAASPPLPPS